MLRIFIFTLLLCICSAIESEQQIVVNESAKWNVLLLKLIFVCFGLSIIGFIGDYFVPSNWHQRILIISRFCVFIHGIISIVLFYDDNKGNKNEHITKLIDITIKLMISMQIVILAYMIRYTTTTIKFCKNNS